MMQPRFATKPCDLPALVAPDGPDHARAASTEAFGAMNFGRAPDTRLDHVRATRAPINACNGRTRGTQAETSAALAKRPWVRPRQTGTARALA